MFHDYIEPAESLRLITKYLFTWVFIWVIQTGVAGDYQIFGIVVLLSSYILALIFINSLSVQLDPMA